MKCVIFNLGAIQVIPASDLCFIFNNGVPIWGGCKDKLIELLESIHKQDQP